MELTAQTINIILLILPGLLGLRFYSYLTGNHPDSFWRHAIDSLIFTLVIYIPLEYFELWAPIVQLQGQPLDIVIAEPHLIASVLSSALILAAVYSLAVRIGLVSRILMSLRLTSLTPHETAWHDVMNRKRYLRVYRKDGEILLGWPKYYSLSANHGFVYLQNFYVHDGEQGGWVHVDNAEGVLLNYSDIDTIEVSTDKMKRK